MLNIQILWGSVFLPSLSGVQITYFLRRIMLSTVAPLVLPYFSTVSHNRNEFWKKKLLNTKRVFWIPLQILSEIFLILRRIQQAIIINLHRSSSKVPVILLRYEWNFRWILKYQIWWKSVQWEPNLSMRADRHDYANGCFSQFCEHA